MSRSTQDVIDLIDSEIDSAIVNEASTRNAAWAVIPDEDVGRFYKLVRQEGLEADMARAKNLLGWISSE